MTQIEERLRDALAHAARRADAARPLDAPLRSGRRSLRVGGLRVAAVGAGLAAAAGAVVLFPDLSQQGVRPEKVAAAPAPPPGTVTVTVYLCKDADPFAQC